MSNTDNAASAAQHVAWGPWMLSTSGAGLTISQVNEYVTLIVGLLTIGYTLLKISEWFCARRIRDEEQTLRDEERRTLGLVWERLERMGSRATPLSDQSHHEGK
jgi:hypothetical protein